MTDRLRSFAAMTVVAVASAAAFWLLRDHWQHASGYLIYAPYLLFFACPLMHLFMHHGHGHGGHGHDLLQDRRNQPPAGSGAGSELSG
jgi:peptidoglycan/LPS O-acetylase OafA/YrhL